MLPGLGAKTLRVLIHRFGDPSSVVMVSVEELTRIPRVTEKLAESIRSLNLDQIEAELASLEDEGIDVLTPSDDDYPANLQRSPDAPAVLFVRGHLTAGDEEAVAIVGSRAASDAGMDCARHLAEGLASEGLTIVSGLALGIDTAAHEGTLEAEGRTLAVLGSGIRVIHPRRNRDLAERIAASGALISEVHPNAPPRGQMLMARDRIISGLSKAVIVVEATEKSGSLDTTKRAHRQGRLVYAVETNSPGTRKLIRQGCRSLSPRLEDLRAIASELRMHKLTSPDDSDQMGLF
jgi:DNA processing protein